MLGSKSILRRSSDSLRGCLLVGSRRVIINPGNRRLIATSSVASQDPRCQNLYRKVAATVFATGVAVAATHDFEIFGVAECEERRKSKKKKRRKSKLTVEAHHRWTPAEVAQENFDDVIEAHEVENLAVVTSYQVSENDGEDGKPIWMSYGGYVYDVTDFIQNHPGGSEKIMMAAGSVCQLFQECSRLSLYPS
jgi:predicted heme/steroid binding protein